MEENEGLLVLVFGILLFVLLGIAYTLLLYFVQY